MENESTSENLFDTSICQDHQSHFETPFPQTDFMSPKFQSARLGFTGGFQRITKNSKKTRKLKLSLLPLIHHCWYQNSFIFREEKYLLVTKKY